MSTFSLTALIPGVGHEYAHVATAGIVGAGLIGVGIIARAQLGSGQAAITPASSFSIRGFFEFITEFIGGLVEMVVGERGRPYIPMFAAIFTFVLVNNLMGVIPGVLPATQNLNTTLAMGLTIFVMYHIFGLMANGMGHLKHFLGPIWWLAPLMVIIELISDMVRPFSLGLRLANVMAGDHTVLGVFLGIFPIGLPIPFYLMGMFVAGVQAFVFTLLSMVYVALATAHHEHH